MRTLIIHNYLDYFAEGDCYPVSMNVLPLILLVSFIDILLVY
jgi:hypothetical protein